MMAPGGHLLIEASEGQAPEAVEAMARSGLIPLVTRSEELNATVVVGTRRAASGHRHRRERPAR
jgi:release factor glutamine methyltransferase